MPRTLSGKELIKLLITKYDFDVVSQKGSHVKLHKTLQGRTITTIVPLHTELAHGTLRGVLRLAGIDYEDFSNGR